MATLTPTSDSRQLVEVKTFQYGDAVTTATGPFAGQGGTVVQVNVDNNPAQVRVRWVTGPLSVAQTSELMRLG